LFICKELGADAIASSYGFPSENIKFPAAAGITFVGPRSPIKAVGLKHETRAIFKTAGVPVRLFSQAFTHEQPLLT
jgi:acetyl/propionyl-CoA carboxylase alpha subunit